MQLDAVNSYICLVITYILTTATGKRKYIFLFIYPFLYYSIYSDKKQY